MNSSDELIELVTERNQQTRSTDSVEQRAALPSRELAVGRLKGEVEREFWVARKFIVIELQLRAYN